MKVLLCHNYYQQPGGEDRSFAAEAALLESRGHRVVRFTVHNDAIRRMGRLRLGMDTIWNGGTYAQIRRLIQRERPTILHATNWFPLLSPSVFHAARAEGVPVVLALRNYRLMCPNALFVREGAPCEDCRGRLLPLPAITHACYRGNRLASAAVTATLGVHRALGTWRRAIDLFFTPSEFARAKFIEGGVPPQRIETKPNFVDPDPGRRDGRGGYAVFVGRLSPEKGVQVLLDAWARVGGPRVLKIVGDGPDGVRVAQAASRDARIQWLGRLPASETLDVIGEAACLVMPSVWYETFGRTIIESFAVGTPVIASRLGTMAELVEDGRTGLHVGAGDPDDLARALQHFFSDAFPRPNMRLAAREEFERKYTAARNYEMLMAIYRKALGWRQLEVAAS